MDKQAAISALQWHIDIGADEALSEAPVDATAMPALVKREGKAAAPELAPAPAPAAAAPQPLETMPDITDKNPLGAAEARIEAVKLARQADSLESLRAAISSFEGLALKKTATNLVFSDGNHAAQVMLIGEAPGADEDRIGKPFVGASGQLLDRMLACIGLDRAAEDPSRAVYISNILNWRPPGNRTPSDAEIEISLPFIEKHISLVRPKLLLLTGGVAAKALLNSPLAISRLRGRMHEYRPVSSGLSDDALPPIPVLATYHPSYLLRTPSQKRMAWQDMLLFQEQRRQRGFL